MEDFLDEWWDDFLEREGRPPEEWLATPEEVVDDEPAIEATSTAPKTLADLTPPLDDPEVVRRGENAYQGALIAWSGYEDDFSKSGMEYSVDPLILASIAGYESGGQPDAIGPTNDAGLMQFTERTWGTIMPDHDLSARLDPVVSIGAAAKLFDRDRKSLGSEDLAVLAYNVGPNKVKSILHGDADFAGKSQYYWPVIMLTHQRLTQALHDGRLGE